MDAQGKDPRPLSNVGVGGHFLRWTREGDAVLFRCPAAGRAMLAPVSGGDAIPVPEVAGGAHMSLSPDHSRVMDVVGHKTLWVSPLSGGKPEAVFAFDDPDARIDYPVWSPDGRAILFDRFRPQGGDIWMLDGVE
jgi:Tol biopolymer transport system component